MYPLHFITLVIIALLQYFSLFNFGSFQIVEINDLYHFILQIFLFPHGALKKAIHLMHQYGVFQLK